MATPVQVRHRASDAAARAACGLVSIPTSSTPPGKSPFSPAQAAKYEAAALRDEVHAFVPDKDGRRLSSLRCAVGSAARLHEADTRGFRGLRAWMVTLTYRPGVEWSPDHLKATWHRFRAWANRQELRARYVWVAELQKRGVIHYHAVVWLPVGVRCPAFDARGWWPHGMTNRKTVRKSAVAYLMKYLSKGTDVSSGSFPKGARIYGVAGLDGSARRVRRWLRLPSFVRGNSSAYDKWDRATGGGWVAPDGQRFASEFAAAFIAGVRCLVRVCTHSRSIVPDGAFSWLTDRQAALACSVPRFA